MQRATTIAKEERVPTMASSGLEEAGPTLSPPHTWTESEEKTEQDDEAGESRHIFTIVATMPEGCILNSQVFTTHATREEMQVGTNLFSLLEPKTKSFLLTASVTTPRHRLFCRVKCGSSSSACELMCEFDSVSQTARVTALALRPAFGPSTPFHSLTFVTKHSATCAISHIDYASIPYLGHLPTDVLGRSILSLICAADVNVVRQAHIDLFNARGKVVKSVAPLRFVAYNGALLQAETEWSAYVNPWTKRIEMVVARHRVVDAPIGDANVLSAPPEGQPINVLPPCIAKGFEDELRLIMNSPVPSSRTGAMCQPAPRPVDVTSYIERVVENLVVSSSANQCPPPKPAVRQELQHPELPLSYTQINCLENVHRLLKSQSRPESPAAKSDSMAEDLSQLPAAQSLTKEALMQHTKRWEDDYKETWVRRLKRMSADGVGAGPQAKQSRPSTSSTPPVPWTAAQREDYYRCIAPSLPLPLGKNYQITSVPLPPHDSCTPSTASMPERSSAFTAVQPKSLPLRDLPPPIALSIQDHPSVIHASVDSLMMPLHSSRLLYARRAENPHVRLHD